MPSHRIAMRNLLNGICYVSEVGTSAVDRYNRNVITTVNRFLPNGSNILKPLYDLEHKHEKFDWTEERETAFLTSKEMFKNSRPGFDIIVAADASPYEVGPVISHIINGKDELAIENDILLLGNRVIIPYQMRSNLLELLHKQHIGMVRMKMVARNEVYWAGIDSDIEQYCNSCKTCLIHQPKATQVPLASWPKTSRRWKRLHIDFLEKYGHHVLIIIDAHSRWMDLYLMKRGTAAGQKIEKLRQSFIYFGIPEQILSDNEPPFNGGLFEENEPVMVYYARGSNGRNWKEGRIAKSATTYLVLVNERVRYVHADYLKHSYNALLSKLNNYPAR
ncbi:Integrase zinc binding domain [Popillia japonica]|uniref:RNA-directed DNA polymerase n=1 Tax=Popillia japonica TaxID=7064 RepID=A0AAW1IDN3_POPJA